MKLLDLKIWWRITGSNRRPLRCQRSALPAELIPQIVEKCIMKVSKRKALLLTYYVVMNVQLLPINDNQIVFVLGHVPHLPHH